MPVFNTQSFIVGQIESSPKPLPENNKFTNFDISSLAAVITALAAIGTLVVAWKQLSSVAKSLQLQAKAIESTAESLNLQRLATESQVKAIQSTAESLNLQRLATQATVVLDCSKHYDLIISSLEENRKDKKLELWWYRLWDLYTKEFFFFRNGLIDKSIYEVWMIELAYRYNEKPFGYEDMEKLRESHKQYLDSRLSASHDDIHGFFNKIIEITNKYPEPRTANDKVSISKDVHQLILNFLP